MNYGRLEEVLTKAAEQASAGKGAERHADGQRFEDQPEDVILAALKAAHAFIDAMLGFYGTDLQVANWHLNGDTQSWDSFFDDNMCGDELDLLSAAIKKAEGSELIAGRIEAVEDGGQIKAGAEAFRRMLLEATRPLFWPHIEGVFKVFAEQHGFAPEEVLDELESKL